MAIATALTKPLDYVLKLALIKYKVFNIFHNRLKIQYKNFKKIKLKSYINTLSGKVHVHL